MSKITKYHQHVKTDVSGTDSFEKGISILNKKSKCTVQVYEVEK